MARGRWLPARADRRRPGSRRVGVPV